MEPNDKSESDQAPDTQTQASAQGGPLARREQWTRSAAEVREDAAELLDKAKHALKKPLVGAGAAGAVVLAAAALWGASEAAVAAVAAYGAYRLLRRRDKRRDEPSGEQPKPQAPDTAAPQGA